MIGLLIMLGFCYLGLAACGVMLIVHDIQTYKWRKRMKKRWGEK